MEWQRERQEDSFLLYEHVHYMKFPFPRVKKLHLHETNEHKVHIHSQKLWLKPK
jgi:hypothetical protein